MGRKRDEIFILGEEPLGEETAAEGLEGELAPPSRSQLAEPPAAGQGGIGRAARAGKRPAAALALAAGTAALAGLLAFRSSDRHSADTAPPLRDRASVVEARVAGSSTRDAAVLGAATSVARHAGPKLRPVRSPRRPRGKRERESMKEKAQTPPPPDTPTPAPAPTAVPEPVDTPPVPPSVPPAPRGRSGPGPEFSFER